MKNIDISILSQKPCLDVKARLTIQPLAPLSMVSELPGSYYKSLRYPSKKMVCGLFENLLGWHFDNDTRNAIINELKKTRKKQKINCDYKAYIQGSTYIPLLMEFFEMLSVPKVENFKALCSYDDYWSKAYRRSDSHQHINGLRYMNADTIGPYSRMFAEIDSNDNLKSNDKNQKKTNWFKEHIGEFAQFYSSPAKKEFVHLDGRFVYEIIIDNNLYHMLYSACMQTNIGYLGNNEGWVDININIL